MGRGSSGGGGGFGSYSAKITNAASDVRKAWHSGDKAAEKSAMAKFQKAYNQAYGKPKDSFGKTDYSAYTQAVKDALGIGLGYGD